MDFAKFFKLFLSNLLFCFFCSLTLHFDAMAVEIIFCDRIKMLIFLFSVAFPKFIYEWEIIIREDLRQAILIFIP